MSRVLKACDDIKCLTFSQNTIESKQHQNKLIQRLDELTET